MSAKAEHPNKYYFLKPHEFVMLLLCSFCAWSYIPRTNAGAQPSVLLSSDQEELKHNTELQLKAQQQHLVSH